jgi:HK97 family phage portal protein
LLERPNPYYSGELLWKAWALSWIINGNSYFLKVRNTFGEVIQLWWEPHFTIRPRWPEDGSEFISFYEVLRNGQWYRVETQDVIHFRCGIDPNNTRLGMAPVDSLLREIFTDNERARYSALILRNGGVIPFVITPKQGVSGKGINADEIKSEFKYRIQGDHVGEPIVLTSAIDLQSVGASPDKLLVEKASEIPEARVCAVIGIPAGVVGFKIGMEQTKVGATMRELREQAWESYVIPTERIIAGELKAQLLIEWGDTDGLRVKHDLSEVRVLQDDRNKLYERETLAYEKGVKMRSEARSALGLDTAPEDEIYFVEPMPLAPIGEDQPPNDQPLNDEPQVVNGKQRGGMN